MNKTDRHLQIVTELNALYKQKNHDYGDSFGETYRKLGIVSALTRISDKYNRLISLATKPENERKVKDESIIDTLRDMANYCIMTVMELEDEQAWRLVNTQEKIKHDGCEGCKYFQDDLDSAYDEPCNSCRGTKTVKTYETAPDLYEKA